MSTVYTNPKPAFTFLEESWTPPRELGINSRFFAPGLKRPFLTESEGYHVIEFPTVEGFTETSPGFGIDHSVPGVAQDVITGELSTRSVAPAPQWRLDVWERSILLVPDQIGSLGLSHGKHGRFYKGLLAPFCLENNNTKKQKKPDGILTFRHVLNLLEPKDKLDATQILRQNELHFSKALLMKTTIRKSREQL